MYKNKFIVFEGLDGSGKSTQIELLSQRLTKNQILNISIREPGSTTVGEKIRNILKSEKMHFKTELLLFNAARAQLIEETIRPALQDTQNPNWILCDRFIPSTWAYQHFGREVDENILNALDSIQHNPEKIEPDIVFLLPSITDNLKPRDELEKINREKIAKGYQKLKQDNWIEVPKMNIENTADFIANSLNKKFEINIV